MFAIRSNARFDLHIHSCLSPCADLEMSPSEIVTRAVAAGMDGIALTDRQSARNTPAFAECARRTGLKTIFAAKATRLSPRLTTF